MAGQEQIKPQRRDDDPGDVPDAPPTAGPAQTSDTDITDITDILDEIDGVLESNAEEFVRGFVQKGGQ